MSYTKKLTKKEHVSKFSYSRNPAKDISYSIRRLNMKITKTIALLLALSVLLVLPGCSRDRDLRKEREQLIATIDKTTTEAEDKPDNSIEVDEKASTAEVLPSAKSSDVELYVAAENGKEYVVNAYGQRADGYSIDSDKNIRDKNQVIVVAAKNTERFQYLSDLSFGSQRYDSTMPNHGLNEQGSGSSDEGTNYSTLTVLLSGAPASATNHVVVLESSNSEIVEIRPNSNAKYLAEGAFDLQSGEIAINLAEAGTARIVLTVKKQGEVIVTAKSLAGTAVANCVVNIKNSDVPSDAASGNTDTTVAASDPTRHIHTYTKTVVDPTPYEKGYTIYICQCGHSYQDNFVPPIPQTTESSTHTHHYESIIVAPTEYERGYTLHLCECGDSYKDCYVSPIGR